MKAKIIQHGRSSTQNAPIENKFWSIEFEPQKGTVFNDKLTGWLSSTDMNSELKIKFSNLESAIAYAKDNNLEYELVEAKTKKLVKKAYADNFK